MNYFYKALPILFLVISCLVVQAQPKGRERLEAAKAAYITRELNLTVEESQKFWPVFNELKREQLKIRRQIRQAQRDLATNNLSESEAKTLYSRFLDTRIQEVELERSYMPKMVEVIGIKRAAKVYPTEKQFLRMLLRNLEGLNEEDLPDE